MQDYNLTLIHRSNYCFKGFHIFTLVLQDVKIPMYITFVAYWLIGFPISIYLGLYTDLKAVGVWIGLLAGLSVAALFLFYRFNLLTKKLIVISQHK